MTGWRWSIRSRAGEEVSTSEGFSTRDDAEAWIATEWAVLLAGGGVAVALFEGDELVYEMGLGPADAGGDER